MQGKTPANSHRQLLSKISTPGQVEAKALAVLFPSNSNQENASSQSVDCEAKVNEITD